MLTGAAEALTSPAVTGALGDDAAAAAAAGNAPNIETAAARLCINYQVAKPRLSAARLSHTAKPGAPPSPPLPPDRFRRAHSSLAPSPTQARPCPPTRCHPMRGRHARTHPPTQCDMTPSARMHHR